MELVAGRTMQLQYLLRTRIVQPLGPATANFSELRQREVVRLDPDPMGEYFSSSCAVTSRNILLHEGATVVTNSPRLDAEAVPPSRFRTPRAELGGPLATVNFGDYPYLRGWVNRASGRAR